MLIMVTLKTMQSVLAILPEGFEEIEAVTPIDLMRRAGIHVTIAAIGQSLLVQGRSSITIKADQLLSELTSRDYNCLFLPGGPGVKLLRADPLVKKFVLEFSEMGRWIAAICAAPTILNDLHLLQKRRYTAHFSVSDELPNILSDQKVVVDGRFITSRGAGTAIEFSLSIIEHIVSPEKAHDVAATICFHH
jgi:4-methyl-5(b-hydroxyethyl)-thiazole monophosphate biosynthesis